MGQINHKVIKRAFARQAFYFFQGVFRLLPYRVVKAMTNFIIGVGFFFVKSKRAIAQESLDIAFGNSISGQEKERIIRTCFANLGRAAIELMFFTDHPPMIREKVSFEGKDRLDNILKEGKGAILVSAHFGNFPLMLLRLVQEGYPLSGIMKQSRDEVIEKDFLAMRNRFGLKTIYSHPRTECVNQSLKVLRNNELLFIPLDQNFGTKGAVFVEFFGQPAATATGPAVFAMRTGAPIVPIFTMRDVDDRHKIIIDEPFYIEEKEDDAVTILTCTTKITQIIERYIRRYPHEWGWMHRRWKTQPKDQQAVETSGSV